MRFRWKIFAAITAGAIPFILFFLYYNWQTTGDPFLTGYQKYFGQSVVPGSGFTTIESWKNWPQEFTRVVRYMQLFHEQFFGWPISSLFLGALLFFFKAQKRFCRLLAMAFFSVFFALTLNPYTLVIFGPRYLYEISSIVIVLTAISLQRIPTIARHYCNIRMPLSQWRGVVCVILVFLVSVALNTTIKELYKKYGHNYRIGRLEFARAIQKSVQKPALVLISNRKLYNGLTYKQPPNDSSDIIIARDRGAENNLLMQHYPERHVYIVRDKKHNIQLIR